MGATTHDAWVVLQDSVAKTQYPTMPALLPARTGGVEQFVQSL